MSSGGHSIKPNIVLSSQRLNNSLFSEPFPTIPASYLLLPFFCCCILYFPPDTINFTLTHTPKQTGFDGPFTLHGVRLRLFCFSGFISLWEGFGGPEKDCVRVFVSAFRCHHMASAVAWLELGLAPGSSSPVFLSSTMRLSPFFLHLRVFLARNFPATQHSCSVSRSI